MLRRIGLALILFGAIGLWVYPTWFQTYKNIDLGTYRIHDASGGFRTVSGISLSPDASPLMVEITGSTAGVPEPGDEPTTFTFVLNGPDGTVTAEVLTIDGSAGEGTGARDDRRVALRVGPITGLGDGEHVFVFGEGDQDGIALSFLDMTLTGAVAAPEWRVRPASIALIGLGLFLALLPLVLRRRRSRKARERAEKPARRRGTSNIGRRVPLDRSNREPEKPKRRWGRGGG